MESIFTVFLRTSFKTFMDDPLAAVKIAFYDFLQHTFFAYDTRHHLLDDINYDATAIRLRYIRFDCIYEIGS